MTCRRWSGRSRTGVGRRALDSRSALGRSDGRRSRGLKSDQCPRGGLGWVCIGRAERVSGLGAGIVSLQRCCEGVRQRPGLKQLRGRRSDVTMGLSLLEKVQFVCTVIALPLYAVTLFFNYASSDASLGE